jgi:hypothetical protein
MAFTMSATQVRCRGVAAGARWQPACVCVCFSGLASNGRAAAAAAQPRPRPCAERWPPCVLPPGLQVVAARGCGFASGSARLSAAAPRRAACAAAAPARAMAEGDKPVAPAMARPKARTAAAEP